MDDEFKLCWKNFQDNIASGFQNLYDRGDLVDVTLACDGKLLHAHKIVLAICSPYFQEIFITNPCKHPIIILKDVTFNIMCELLEFMYQGVVNVKHTELQSFMKIGQLLQIKGLATNSSSSAASTSSEKSSSQVHNAEETSGTCSADAANGSHTKNATAEHDASNSETSSNIKQSNINSVNAARSQSPTSSPSPMGFGAALSQQSYKNSPDGNAAPSHHSYHANAAHKRLSDFGSEALSIYSRKQFKRSAPPSDNNSEHTDGADTGMDQLNPEDFFLPTIPHISMVESRYDLNSVKRESDHHALAASSGSSLRNSYGPAFGFDYNLYKNSSSNSGVPNSGAEYPNDLHMPNDYSKNFGNHMDIPAIAPGEHWWQGKLEFMLSQRGKPLLVHDGHTFGIQYVRKDKKYWQCNLSRKFNCKARVTTTDTGEIIVTNNEHCHTEIRQHLRKDYQRSKAVMNALINLSTSRMAENLRRHNANASLSMGSLNNPQPEIAHSSTSLPARQPPPAEGVEEQGVLLDLGKTSGATVITATGAAAHGEKPELQKVPFIPDDEVPLDCGMRSASVGDASKKNQEREGRENKWKCEEEALGSQ